MSYGGSESLSFCPGRSSADGSRVMTWLLPPPLRASYVSLERFGLLLVIVFVFMVPPVRAAMSSAIQNILFALEDLTRFS